MVYVETSALAKLYIKEPGGTEIAAVLQGNEQRLFTSLVTYAETLSTLSRAWREARISQSDYHRHKRAFRGDWSALNIVALTSSVLAPAERIIERHALRGFDAIHLCSALWIGRPRFACFDTRLRTAAEAEGLIVIP